MAIVVPSAKLAITPRLAYGRGYPILSGEDSDDLTIGLRGLTQQINYRYSLGRCLFTLDQWATPGSEDKGAFFYSTASASYGGATGYASVRVGEDIAGLTLIADVEDLDVRLTIDGGASSTGAGLTTRGTVTDDTLTVTGGASYDIRVDAKRKSGSGTGYLFRIAVYETKMTAGDFP